MMINKADPNNFIVCSQQTRFLKSRKENSIHFGQACVEHLEYMGNTKRTLSARRKSTRETWLLQRTSAASLQRTRTAK
jgi:hypothetical protein